MRSISASLSPPDAWMRICCSLPVPLSFAWTLTMPLASMSKVTSICGTPRGAGGMPTRSKLPSSLLSAAIFQSEPARLHGLLNEIVHQRFELGAGELHGQVLGSRGVSRDERQVDLGLSRGRELDLRLLGRLLEPLERELVPAQVDALLL